MKPKKDRVKMFGEVFTPPIIVEAMLNLLPQDVWGDLSKTFLEPSFGQGAFLIPIYDRKLLLCNELAKTYEEWVSYAIFATSTIYGVELLYDNVCICRKLMYEKFMEWHTQVCTAVEKPIDQEVIRAVTFYFDRNLRQQDFLTMNPLELFTDWRQING